MACRNVMIVCCFLFSAALVSADDASHEQAVVELLDAMHLEQTAVGGADAMAGAMIQANPMLRPYHDVLVAWAHRYMTWEAMAPELIRIYKEALTEVQVRETTAFYKSPTGQVLVAKLPELMQKGAAVGVAIAQAHEADLKEMIAQRAEEINEQIEGAPSEDD